MTDDTPKLTPAGEAAFARQELLAALAGAISTIKAAHDESLEGSHAAARALLRDAIADLEAASVAPFEDHVPAGPEAEADTDAALGLVLLPPIRVSAHSYAALNRIAKAQGMVLQAVVRSAIAAIDALDQQPTGGSPEHMLQDQSRGLSQWLATRPDARRHAQEAAASIRHLQALRQIVHAYEFRTELLTNDADCAAHLYDIARAALPPGG